MSTPLSAQHPARDSSALLAELGVQVEPELLRLALTHRSYAYEHGGLPTNERLEFLGDSVLGLVVTDALYRSHPELAEGQLAKLRAAVVNMRALAAVARALDLGDYLYLGRGEVTTGGRDKPSILADTLEAVIGAVYIDSGIEVASSLVRRLINPLLRDSAALGAGLDWKTSLQELSAMTGAGAPEYVLTQEGPDHAKTFTAEVRIEGERLGGGQGGSKKQAEQEAAAQAWAALRKRHPETAT